MDWVWDDCHTLFYQWSHKDYKLALPSNLPKAKISHKLQQFMEQTNSTGSTSDAWVQQLSAFVSAAPSEQQAGIFKALGSLLGLATQPVVDALMESLKKANYKSMWDSLSVFGKLQKVALPDLWSATVEEFTRSLLCNQDFFTTVAGNAAKFLPEPNSAGADPPFFERCASHRVPDLDTLGRMAPILDKQKQLDELVVKRTMDNLMFKTSATLRQILVLSGDFPLPVWSQRWRPLQKRCRSS